MLYYKYTMLVIVTYCVTLGAVMYPGSQYHCYCHMCSLLEVLGSVPIPPLRGQVVSLYGKGEEAHPYTTMCLLLFSTILLQVWERHLLPHHMITEGFQA